MYTSQNILALHELIAAVLSQSKQHFLKHAICSKMTQSNMHVVTYCLVGCGITCQWPTLSSVQMHMHIHTHAQLYIDIISSNNMCRKRKEHHTIVPQIVSTNHIAATHNHAELSALLTEVAVVPIVQRPREGLVLGLVREHQVVVEVQQRKAHVKARSHSGGTLYVGVIINTSLEKRYDGSI